MSNGPESYSPNTSDPERYEGEPGQKYSVHVEQWEDAETEERAKFLDVALGEKTDSVNEEAAQKYKEEFQTMVANWKETMPEHTQTITQLEQQGSIFNFVGEVWRAQDREKVQAVRELCKSILKDYGGRWDELSEDQKRHVRVAEMTVFTTDALKMGMDISSGRVNEASFRKTADKMEKYSKSVDLSMSFKQHFLEPIVRIIRENPSQKVNSRRTSPGRQSAQPQSDPILTPWEYGNLHELWGESKEKVYDYEEIRDDSEEEDEGYWDLSKEQDPNIINMKRNPETGVFEAENNPAPDISPTPEPPGPSMDAPPIESPPEE